MRRAWLFLLPLALSAQVVTIPNTTFPTVRSLMNSNFSYLSTNKEPSIAAGTTSQYWRGDKTWQPILTNLSQFTNGPGYLTANQTITVSGACSGAGTINISLTCTGGGGISGPGTTVSGYVALWSGALGAALSAGLPVTQAGAASAVVETDSGGGVTAQTFISANSSATGALQLKPGLYSGLVALPAAGNCSVFLDSSNGNKLSLVDHSGTVTLASAGCATSGTPSDAMTWNGVVMTFNGVTMTWN